MIPPRYAPQLFALILSGLMSLLVSGIATLRASGLGPPFMDIWLFAFPTVLLVAPLTQRLVRLLVSQG